jgi:hypothetical protein
MKHLLALALVAAACAGTAAQESTLRAQRTVEFRTGRAAELKATAGPVKVMSIEFTDLGRGATSGRLNRLRTGVDSEASTLLRGRVLAENPSADEWAVTFVLEFLDKNDAVIEKVTKRSTWEGESKAYEFEHPILAYVVPLIAKVRVSMEGKLD